MEVPPVCSIILISSSHCFGGPSAWCCTLCRTCSHELYQARFLPQYTHHLLNTPGVVEVRNSRRQAADKSYIFCVSLGGSGVGEWTQSVFVFMCVRLRHVSPHIWKCVLADARTCVRLPTVMPVSQTKEPIGAWTKKKTKTQRGEDLDLITRWFNTGQTTAR